jgi:hypothetical protein
VVYAKEAAGATTPQDDVGIHNVMKDLVGATMHVAKTPLGNGSVLIVLTMILAVVRAWIGGGIFTTKVKVATSTFAMVEHCETLRPIFEHVLWTDL